MYSSVDELHISLLILDNIVNCLKKTEQKDKKKKDRKEKASFFHSRFFNFIYHPLNSRSKIFFKISDAGQCGKIFEVL